jgi:hypothetical protein
MKKKITAITAGVLAFCLFGASCQIHRSFDSLVPEEYGAWENYYIYHGNVRSRTTGEMGEYLVDDVVVDGETYVVSSCADSEIVGESIYLCLKLQVEKDCLVAYNIEDGTYKLLMTEYTCHPEEGLTYTYRPYTIEKVYGNGDILLYGQREGRAVNEQDIEQTNYQSVYFTIYHDGTFKEETLFAGYDYSRISDEYFTKLSIGVDGEEATLYYITFGMEEGVEVCTFDNGEVYVEYDFVDKNGVQGLLLKTYALEDETPLETYVGERLQKVEFFNLKTNNLVSLYQGNQYVEWIEIPDSEYFITYEYEKVNYTTKDGLFSSPIEQEGVLKSGGAVYQIVYSTENVKAVEKYTFDGMGLQSVRGVANGELYISLEWYENAAGCKNGGHQSQAYKVGLNMGGPQKIKQEEYNKAKEICAGWTAEVACGDYSYYIERVALSTVNDRTSYAYRLMRYHTKNQTSEVMQLWKGVGSDEREKYCEMMWINNGGDMDDFIVRHS